MSRAFSPFLKYALSFVPPNPSRVVNSELDCQTTKQPANHSAWDISLFTLYLFSWALNSELKEAAFFIYCETEAEEQWTNLPIEKRLTSWTRTRRSNL